VHVRGDEDTILVLCSFVARGLHAVVADVGYVVASRGEPVADPRGERVVEEKPQPEAVSGSSRSRTASAA
jgi:hypothetical protein